MVLRNNGQSVNHVPLQYLSDEKSVCANRLLVDLQVFERLCVSSGQSIVFSPLRCNSLDDNHSVSRVSI